MVNCVQTMRTPRSIFALSFVLAAALALSTPAFSQPKASGADDAQQADEHFRKGKELLKAGKKKEAREEYLAAFQLKRSYDVAGNLGSLELTLGLPRDAAEHLSFALHNYAASGSTPEQLERARQRLIDALVQVGTVRVSVNIDGAEVLVDGKAVGRAPLGDTLFVDVGERTIEARLAGYESAKQTIKIAKAQAQAVKLTLVVASPPVAIASPSPSVMVSASAAPVLTASVRAALPPVPSGSTAPVVPGEQRGPSRTVLVTGGVAAGAAVLAGVAFAVISNGKSSDVQAQLGTLRSTNGARACTGPSIAAACTTVQDTIGAKDTFANLALWSFVGAGALGIGTAVYGLVAPQGTKNSEVRAVPIVTANGGGIVIGGAW